MPHLKTVQFSRSFVLLGVMIFAGLLPATKAVAQTQYGSISGKILFTGDVPKTKFLIQNGNLASGKTVKKVAAACGAMNLKRDDLIVDAKTKGIGNILIFLRKAPKTIHPALQAVPKETLIYDQKQCMFTPRILLVRAGQTVKILSDDPVAHNFQTFPFSDQNTGVNFVVTPKDRKGKPVVLKAKESSPMTVSCSMHTWMKGYWLVLDHPYAVATVSQGKEIGSFKIDKLPVGEYEFRVWHEKPGYINLGTKRGFKITVKANQDINKTFKVSAETSKELAK